jgi:alkaline phosphatase
MRSLTHIALAALGTALIATPVSAQTIYPIDRAAILAGSQFDLKVEFPGVVGASQAKVTINGRPAAQVLGRDLTLIEREDGKSASSLILRDVSLSQPGVYTVAAEDGTNSASVTWEVYATPGPRTARNVILFIGDGMSVAHVTAARILSRQMKEGRYRGLLAMDTMPHMAMIGTSGVDSVVTDSANSASAYATGHKSSVNALGVYASRADNNLEHPKVETIARLVKRQLGIGVGVVTNTEIEDATPAAMVAHTRRRSDYDVIVQQFFEVQPDVIMGGGSSNFLPKSTPGSRRADEQDYIARFRQAGYPVTTTNAEMRTAVTDPSTRKLLGLFHPRNMDGALDRLVLRGSTVKDFPDQPDLTEQTRSAIEVLSRNPGGFFLMVESGLIDKFSHPLDWERAAYDTIMLDNSVKVALDFAGNRNDTLVIVVPDHAHGISIIGTVDDTKTGDMRERVGIYDKAGFPNYPPPDAAGYPSRVDVSRRLAVFFNNYPDYCETFRPHMDKTNVPAIQTPERRYIANEENCKVPGAVRREGITPRGTDTGVHSADDVVLRAVGPGAERFRGFMDNTDVFRVIAHALSLGR